MKLLLTPHAVEDLAYWQSSDSELARKIKRTLHELAHDAPLSIHQITPLTLRFPQLLSVKITSEHRLVFERLGNDIIVHQCRYHY